VRTTIDGLTIPLGARVVHRDSQTIVVKLPQPLAAGHRAHQARLDRDEARIVALLDVLRSEGPAGLTATEAIGRAGMSGTVGARVLQLALQRGLLRRGYNGRWFAEPEGGQ